MIDLSLLPGWRHGLARRQRAGSHLVLSTRIRLARNLATYPVRAPESTSRTARRYCGTWSQAARETVSLRNALTFRLDRLERVDRQLLHERHLVSKELAGIDGEPGTSGRGRRCWCRTGSG